MSTLPLMVKCYSLHNENIVITNFLRIIVDIRVTFDFKALESDDARLLNQLGFLTFADFGVLGDSDWSDGLAASEDEVFNAFGISLDFFLDFFDFDFVASSPLEKTSSSS